MGRKRIACSLLIFFATIFTVLIIKDETKAFAEDGPTRVYSAETGVVWGSEWFKEGDIYYYIAKKPQNGKNGEVYAAGCDDGFTGSIKIPAMVRHSSKDYNVLGVNDYAFSEKQIKSVEIADGVGLISDYAFYNCTNLEKVKLGSDIKKIGCAAFFQCEKLTSINLPDKFEINCDPLNDHYAEFIVKKNSKAHKALMAYIEEKQERNWKVKTR